MDIIDVNKELQKKQQIEQMINISLWQVLFLREIADVAVETSSVIKVTKNEDGDSLVFIEKKISDDTFCNLCVYECGTVSVKCWTPGSKHSDHLQTTKIGREENISRIKMMLRSIK